MNTLTDLLGADDQPWMSDPNRPCRSPIDDPNTIREWADRWFPRPNRGPDYARQLCAGCPQAVKDACLRYGIDNNLEGVLGGMTETERAEIRDGAVA